MFLMLMLDAHGSSVADRLARRNLALSQLTNTPVHQQTPSTNVPTRPEDDDEEISDDEDDGDDGDEELTLAQVVAEWSVENVCLWLHEDVGVPEVVPRFQQRRCNGEMLLALTESDLINDYAIKNRIHRERILSAIDAIKTSEDFSDEDDFEDEDDDEDFSDDGEEEEAATQSQCLSASLSTSVAVQGSSTMPRATPGNYPHSTGQSELLRRNSSPAQPSPQLQATQLPSSNSMLRRINSALNVQPPLAGNGYATHASD
ncbi:hypothetical protein PINS_up001319 [Pythium insidiosum]|nr:hypothetical protein PINS_up001319 [Pythium insidiosum]